MKNIWLWILAFLITIGAAIYQRMTGPTYPKKINITLNGKEYKIKLPRSHGGQDQCPVIIPAKDSLISAFLYYKRYKVNENYTAIPMSKTNKGLIAFLPGQPPAGKLEYYIEFSTPQGKIGIPKDETVVIRFKGIVPSYILALHIFFMFFAMMWANYTALAALYKKKHLLKPALITLILFFIGGIIFGPIVQKYAFGEYWTGIPFGWDLTDNKTLIVFIAWIIAVLFNIKKTKQWAIIIAAIITLMVYSIPHSMHGSELDYKTGVVKQG